MLAITTTDTHTNGIIVIDKLLIFIIAIVLSVLSLITISTDLVHSEYYKLEENVRGGRFVLSDIDRLTPYTMIGDIDKFSCNLQVRKTAAVLAIYVSDLAAFKDGIRSLADPGGLKVQMQRARAMSRVRDVLVCAPLDGDMWFRLSLLSFIMKMEGSNTSSFLAWSERAAPHETWVKNQRDVFSHMYRDLL